MSPQRLATAQASAVLGIVPGSAILGIWVPLPISLTSLGCGPHLGTWKGPRVLRLTWQDSMPRLWATMTGYPQRVGLVATQGTLGRRPGTADERPKNTRRRESGDSWALRG